jgi:hypothetical protein
MLKHEVKKQAPFFLKHPAQTLSCLEKPVLDEPG